MQAASSVLLKNAVHQDCLTSKTGLAQRLFSWWFNGLVYNQIWEDPRVDLQALRLDSSSQVLTIASGGCNTLNYLAAQPARIVAVDLNPYHMYLTRLKLAALKHLPDYESFFQFFGKANQLTNVTNYHAHIRPHLDEATRHYWEGRNSLGEPRIQYFTRNFYHHARSGYFLRFLHSLGRWVGIDCRNVLTAQTLEEQEKIFQEQISPLFDKPLVRTLSNWSFAVFSLGIPPQQCDTMRAEGGGQLAEVYRERVRRLACDFPIQDNYFAWQSFGLRYDQERRHALPDYLKHEHYPTLRERTQCVETHIASLTDYLKRQPEHSFDGFVLLDSQDWMKPAVITALWQEIARTGRPGSRIIFRTAASTSPVETALPQSLRSGFHYMDEESRTLHKLDRSAIYGGFHLYIKG